MRHADRLPISPCWINDSNWNCLVENLGHFQPISNQHLNYLRPPLTSSDGHTFSKTYVGDNPTIHTNCAPGHLTHKGFEQGLNNGKLMRKRYVEQLKFLPDQLDPKLISVRTTDMQRTFATAQALIDGLYPCSSQTMDQKISINEEFTATIHAQNSCIGSPVINFQTMSAKDWLISNPKDCPKYLNLLKEFYNTPIYREFYDNQLDPLLKEVNNSISSSIRSHFLDMLDIIDCVNAFLCHDYPLPYDMTEDFYNRLMDNISLAFHLPFDSKYNYNHTEVGRLSSGKLLYEIQQQFQKVLANKSKEIFKIYSGHDITLTSLLSTLGVWDKKWIPYNSTVFIELWQDMTTLENTIRFIYNDQEVAFPFVENTPCVFCSFSEFLSSYQSVILQDWEHSCHI